MTEWTELRDLNEVAIAQKSKWEIEIDTTSIGDWKPWNEKAWMDYMKYRGRPRQPKNEDLLIQAIARGWCAKGNSNKTVDPELAMAIAIEVRLAFNLTPIEDKQKKIRMGA